MSGPHDVVTTEAGPSPCRNPTTSVAEYWAAAARGELLVQECPRCGHRQFYPRALCTGCGGDPVWLTASGRGTVHTFTSSASTGCRPFRDELPYVVAMVELDEGPLMMGNVTDCQVDDVHVGMPVEVHFVKVDDEVGVAFWRPSGG